MKKVRKIIFMILGILVGVILTVVITVVISAFLYIPRQKPVFVNQALTFSNQLAIPSLLQPTVENGEKVFALTIQKGKSNFFPGQATSTFGFNGNYLGPTIRIHTGDKIRMQVTNTLNEATTVHWHGMDLPAKMDGGPHQVINSKEIWQPYWTIKNEAATLWYHPHLMGKTGEHVYKGMAGMIIIDDKNSDTLSLPKDYGVDDLPIVVQDREFDSNNQLVYAPHRKDELGETGMLGDKILVNGTYAPYVAVPSKLVRLRILNASNARRYNFGFDDNRTFYQISTDGGFLNAPVARTRMTLSPGERAEIVVDMRKTTTPIHLISDAVHEGNIVLRFVRNLVHANRDENQVFTILELRPQSTRMAFIPLPQQLNTIKQLSADQAVKIRKFILDPGSQTINGKKMDATYVNEIVHSGDTEIWEISNRTGTYHPIHIHAVQFQILTREGKSPADYEKGWKDTVLVPNGQTVRVIARFPDYSDPHSAYMYHCHILEHEDMGMMGQFVIVSKDTKDFDVSLTDPPGSHMEGM